MAGSVLVAVLLTARSAVGFVTRTELQSYYSSTKKSIHATRFLASSTTDVSAENSVSRISTLQTLLTRHGAPGSVECRAPNDLVAVESLQDTPELVSRLSGPGELANLHPYLFPIVRSKSSGNYICAYRNPFVEEAERQPWPIVEAKLGGPGMSVLALNSEHLMRRIACECDFDGTDDDTVRLYNEGLGMGLLKEQSLDLPYEPGSVSKLGYGAEKFVLLRVGPFPDLYQKMAQAHAAKGDEQSSLIAAETLNAKVPGFASNFLFYARLLKSFPNREEESRDAARMCLRLPLSTIGLTSDELKAVAILGKICDESDPNQVALQKLKDFYEKMREAERDEDPKQGKTPEQIAIDEANRLIDIAALESTAWSEVRPKIAHKFRSIGRDGMANFIDFSGALV